MSGDLSKAFEALKKDEVLDAVKSRVEKGEDPIQILDECRKGVTKVGDLYQKREYYLAELILSGELFKKVLEILEPHMAKTRQSEPLGKVVLATLKGDIHDLGKNILAILLGARGFEVHNLGVDADPDKVLEQVKKIKPDFVGFSALITTAFESMKQTVKLFEEAGIRNQFKLMLGGGVTTPGVKDYIGADFQTLDAMEGVEYCIKMIKERKIPIASG
ncbi:MAG: cobalamin B12-binding domain-containing protein [Candidatus Helarchaeota archaeon]|nr:cobalamin B12-binding domain-containing protein [Candidatus Helarchaeota archaeon]